jgi:hypothetical protein
MKYFLFIVPFLSICTFSCREDSSPSQGKLPRYIQVCKENTSYFSYSDGTPYIPIGINLINPSGRYQQNPDSAFYEIEQWMKQLSENGGNYIRIWLSQSFWDMEDEMAGKYSDEKIKRIDRFFEMARKFKLRVKITLEHFRSLTLEENPQKWATKFVYHTSQGGPLDSIRQYITSEAGHYLFLDKVDFYKNRYGSDTLFFGWELWNEMNAMKGPEDSLFFSWNEKMLHEVKQRFPENLVMQSLGSFDDERIRPVYEKMMLLPGNEIAQVHSYLDLGAKMEVCQAPMDVICASAIDELISYNSGKPVILAETGAVEPRHSGPSKYYPLDTAGILLHDILFAPFFSGSAGAGMSWHWESYVHKNNLWYHFGRFHEAIKGINPIEEKFIPMKIENAAARIYMLVGNNNSLLWLRDKTSDWKTELEQGVAPPVIQGMQLNLKELGVIAPAGEIGVYDPWKNTWSRIAMKDNLFPLPDFKRSLVVRINSK